MYVELPYIDYAGFQDKLDATFGQGVFTLEVAVGNTPQDFYLHWNAGTPQLEVDAAIAMANENAAELLNAVKVRLYSELQLIANRTITLKVRPTYADSEVDLAAQWIANQSSQPPVCVLYTASLRNCTNLEAAEFIVNSSTEYQQFISTVDGIKSAGQAAIFTAATFLDCKTITGPYIEQLKNLVEPSNP